ncbi:MAG: RHS repeat-associated protein [Cellvibrionaceae bacterium]
MYTVTYNGKGRADQINGVGFEYDANDYRIQNGDTLHYLEGEHLEASYSVAGTLESTYFRGVIIDEIVNGFTYHSDDANDWTNTTFHHDHLNSVTAQTGHTGTVETTTAYDAFGAPQTLPGTGNDLLYTGREYDQSTGLYYYRARYYDPELGRFISEDPLGFAAGINFYAYVNNNPVNYNDPSGKIAFAIPLITGGIGAIAGATGSVIGQIVSGGFSDFSLTEVGVATGVGFVAGAAAPFTGTTFLAGAALGGIANIAQLGINEAISGNLANVTVSDVALAGVTGLAGGAMGSSVTRSTGLRFSETSQFIDLASARQLNLSTDIATITAGSALSRNVGGAVASNIDLGGVTFDNLFSGNPASGGFVLYPNRPNTNTLQSIYSK